MITGTHTIVPDAAGRITQSAILRLDCDTSSAPVIINLPPIADLKAYRNVRIVVFDGAKNASVNNITINGAGSESLGSDGVEVIATDAGGVTIGVASPTEWITTDSSEMTGAGSGAEWYSSNDIEIEALLAVNPLTIQDYTPSEIITEETVVIEGDVANPKMVSFSNLTRIQAGGLEMGLTGIASTVAEILPKVEELNIVEGEIVEQSVAGDVSLPKLKKIISSDLQLEISTHPTAEAITLPELEEVQIAPSALEAAISIGNSPLVTTVSAEKLAVVRNLVAPTPAGLIIEMGGMPLLNTLSILESLLKASTPDAETFLVAAANGGANGMDSITNEEIQRLLTAVSPSLDIYRGVAFDSMTTATSLVLAATGVAIIAVADCINLTDFDMSTVTETETVLGLGIIAFSGSAALTSILVAPALATKAFGANGCALPIANVDAILASLNAGGSADGEVDLSGGTNGIPTGGATNADIVALEANGWTVTVNA